MEKQENSSPKQLEILFLKNKLKINPSTTYKNSIYLYLSNFADYGMGLIILPFIARTLGPIEIGKIGISQTFGIFVLILIQYGFSIYGVREVSRLRNNDLEIKRFISEAFSAKIVLIPFIAIFSLVCMIVIPSYKNIPFYLTISIIGSIFQGLVPNWYFEGIEKIKTLAICKSFFRLMALILILLLVNEPEDAWIVLASFSLSSIFQFYYLFFEMKKQVGIFKVQLSFSTKKIFTLSKYSFLISIIPTVYQNISMIIVSQALYPVLIGYYFASMKIYLGFNNLLSPLGQAFFPKLTNINQSNSFRFFKEIRNFFYVIFSLSIFLFSILYFLSDRIVLVLLGEQYHDTTSIIKLFSFVIPLTAISHVLGRQWLMVKSKDLNYAFIQSFSSLTGILFLSLLINRYFLLAVPISLIISETVSIALIIFHLFKMKNE